MRGGCVETRDAYFPAMIEFSVLLPDEAATARFGARLAPRLRAGDVVALAGPLGAGKTTLARALITALTAARDVPSPTFTLVETYDAAGVPLRHFDLYRLEAPDEVWELGFEEAQDGVTLIEWPERIKDLLPPSALLIRLSMDAGGRRALVRGKADWAARLDGLNAA